MLEAAIQIVKELIRAGHQALFAGGCVRDKLLGKKTKDYDIATSARPEEVQRLFPHSLAVGAHFGVIIVRRGDLHFEVATFRRDGVYQDGRHPDTVEFSSAEEDAKRRDFTVNGLFFDPLKNQIVDYVGGREDLDRRVIRAIGDAQARFREDHLRLLRAVRFATVLDFAIETQTWDAMLALAPLIQNVSAERIREECVKILQHPRRVLGFDLLVESGLLKEVLPEILAMKGCEQPPQFHPEGDVFTHTRIMLGLLKPDASLPLVLSVLFHDIAKPDTYKVDESGRIRFNGHDKIGAEKTAEIMRRLKFANSVIAPTVEAVANHMVFKDVQKMRVSRLKRFMARPTFEDEMELHRVDCASSHGLLDNYEYLRANQAAFAHEQKPLVPKPLVTGNDLMSLGLPAGPRLGAMLQNIQDMQLEGSLTSKEEAMEWAKKAIATPYPD